MPRTPLLPDQEVRSARFRSYDLLDTGSERDFDDLCRLAALVCGAPMALITLFDGEGPWFQAAMGFPSTKLALDPGFCDRAADAQGRLNVHDTAVDPLWVSHPLVSGRTKVRSCTGLFLVAKDGQRLGVFCVFDREAKSPKPHQQAALGILARQVVTQLELRRTLADRNQRNEDKDRFLSVIAHDLRSPFSGLLGLTGLLLSEGETMERAELLGYLRMVNQSLRRVYELSENLLKWALLDQARMAFLPKDLAVEGLFDEVEAFQRDAVRQKRLVLDRRLPPGLVIQGDPNLLEACLRNLLSNAVKFTAPGGTITLFAETDPHEVRLGVQDSGRGMTIQQLEELASGAAARSNPGTEGEMGTGLGLTLVRQLAVRHGGQLRLESRVGVGTTATLVLRA